MVCALQATCVSGDYSTGSKKNSISPFVFAHYMLLTRSPNGDYTNDINLARAAGIDAFAINFGGWNVNFTQ